jgi:hypothetical protein
MKNIILLIHIWSYDIDINIIYGYLPEYQKYRILPPSFWLQEKHKQLQEA